MGIQHALSFGTQYGNTSTDKEAGRTHVWPSDAQPQDMRWDVCSCGEESARLPGVEEQLSEQGSSRSPGSRTPVRRPEANLGSLQRHSFNPICSPRSLAAPSLHSSCAVRSHPHSIASFTSRTIPGPFFQRALIVPSVLS